MLRLRGSVGGADGAEVEGIACLFIAEATLGHWHLDWKPVLGETVGKVHPCVVSLLTERLI